MVILAAALLTSGGCAAITNPVADGVRVRHLPPELLATPRACEQTVPLTLLEQPPPDSYRVAAGDVLGVYIETVLGDRNLPMPLHVAPPLVLKDQRRLPPASGFPVTVQADGTIILPSVPPLPVTGRTLAETRDAIRELYLSKKVIQPENDRIFVTLMQPRQYQVVVLRQETGAFTVGPYGPIASSKRSTGFLVDLPAYENDVLHALAQTGGLPGLDTYNAIVIQRAGFRNPADRDAMLKELEKIPAGANPLKFVGAGCETIRVPLRLPPGAPLPVRPRT